MDAVRNVTIAVMTFRRPDDLDEILPRLTAQAAASTEAGTSVSVLVVDNDPAGAARQQVGRLTLDGAASRVRVRYENEPVPGISAARNRALDASSDTDILVFIDDDERPVDGWLAMLLETFDREKPVAVVGPVVSRFEVEPEPWVAAGRFFDRRRLPTGTRIDVAATNNLLLDLHAIRAAGLRFDLDFGITGGGDTLFTKQIGAHGGEMVWCDEAVVYDIVPQSRVTRRWVLVRALRSGNSWSLTSVINTPRRLRRLGVRVVLTGHGLVRVLGGSARYVAGVVLRRDEHQAKGLRTAARGLGMAGGAWGYRYREYRRASA
jgi:glycosyltransferase involved in cell wall biosynthesis